MKTKKNNSKNKSRKSRKSQSKIYKPLDNGGHPFIVYVNKEIEITRENGKKLCRIPYKKLFASNGTSLLVKKRDEYIYIGANIKSFKAHDEIKTFYSPVGNAEVVYPYAVGDKYTYLMVEDKYIPNEFLTKEDPYKQYYDFENVYKIKKYARDLKMKVLFKP
jgi:hypothetical protein